jgi:hypothetical protein
MAKKGENKSMAQIRERINTFQQDARTAVFLLVFTCEMIVVSAGTFDANQRVSLADAQHSGAEGNRKPSWCGLMPVWSQHASIERKANHFAISVQSSCRLTQCDVSSDIIV